MIRFSKKYSYREVWVFLFVDMLYRKPIGLSIIFIHPQSIAIEYTSHGFSDGVLVVVMFCWDIDGDADADGGDKIYGYRFLSFRLEPSGMEKSCSELLQMLL